jgi:DNA-directed RNA polymerase subunit alpha
VKIDGVSHEFSTIEGVKEDVVVILLNLKKIRFKLIGEGSQVVSLSVKGPKKVTAGDIKASGQVEVLTPEQYICEITDKVSLDIELTIEQGLGFVPRDVHQKAKVDIGTIALDAIFTPIRRVSYEVENMRVGDKTNHNRLRIIIETDGTLSPRQALERSIEIMILQLQAIFDFKGMDMNVHESEAVVSGESKEVEADDKKEDISDVLKTRIDTLNLSTRTLNALTEANIRTVGGIARKKKEDLLEIEGIGEKGITEIKKVLSNFGITLK